MEPIFIFYSTYTCEESFEGEGDRFEFDAYS